MNTDLLPHLLTNYVPTDQERNNITTFLRDRHSEIQVLQYHIGVIRAESLALKEQHTSLQRTIDINKAVISPIRSVPVEILQRIFLHCLPHDREAAIQVQECPLLLTHICSYWRAIALSTPRLWASLHIAISTSNVRISRDSQEAFFDMFSRIVDHRIEAVTEWLRRSGDCTLDITLFSNADYVLLQRVLDVILPLSNRWGSLHLYAKETFLGRIQALKKNNLPRLHTVTFSMGNDKLVSRWAGSGIFQAKTLKSLCLYPTQLNPDLNVLTPARHSQITSLYLHGIHCLQSFSFLDLCNFLAQFPLLAELGMEISTEFRTPAMMVMPIRVLPTVSLHCLTSFSMQFSKNTGRLTRFFQALDMPVVTSASVFAYFQVPISQLLSNVSHTLRVLVIDPTYMTCAEFGACMCALRNLTHLTVTRNTHHGYLKPLSGDSRRNAVQLDDTFLSLFILPQHENNSDQTFVPILSAFRYEITSCFSQQVILDFVYSRRSHLKTVYIKRNQKDGEDDFNLLVDGIDLVFY